MPLLTLITPPTSPTALEPEDYKPEPEKPEDFKLEPLDNINCDGLLDFLATPFPVQEPLPRSIIPGLDQQQYLKVQEKIQRMAHELRDVQKGNIEEGKSVLVQYFGTSVGKKQTVTFLLLFYWNHMQAWHIFKSQLMTPKLINSFIKEFLH